MSFDKQWYGEKFIELLEKRDKGKFYIRPSTAGWASIILSHPMLWKSLNIRKVIT